MDSSSGFSSFSSEKRRFSRVDVESDSSRMRSSGTPRATSPRRMHSASLMPSSSPCPPEAITSVSGFASAYSAATSMRLRSAPLGEVPLTFAPSTMMQSSPAGVGSSAPLMMMPSTANRMTSPTATSTGMTRRNPRGRGDGRPVRIMRATSAKRTSSAVPISGHSHRSDWPKRMRKPLAK